MTRLIGSRSSVEFGPGKPVLLINDELRVYDQTPEALAELKGGRCDTLVHLAQAGAQAGCEAVDILLDHPNLDEVETLSLVLRAVDAALGCPLSLDSRNPRAIAAALETGAPDGAPYPGKALLNSVTGEQQLLDELLPLVKKYGMAVVGLLLDERGVPPTWQERLAVGRRILAATDAVGIPRDDVTLDCVVLAASTTPGSLQVTLDTLRAVHDELGVSTLLGIGNAGFGMPDPRRIDLAYLIAAIPWGLNAALVDCRSAEMLALIRAADFLAGNDPVGRRYISLYRSRKT
jgi:5-methyltetrahydrofolate--homocysteine methyltransferase